MRTREIKYTPIGIVHSPFTTLEGMPIQPSGAKGITGTVELKKQFAPGLKDLNGFSHIMLFYHFHLAKGCSLNIIPFLDRTPRGVFATRVPKRPNPIGVSVVKLVNVEGNMLLVENVDIIDRTPLLDIKPYVSMFDCVVKEKSGWLTRTAHQSRKKKSDARFT